MGHAAFPLKGGTAHIPQYHTVSVPWRLPYLFILCILHSSFTVPGSELEMIRPPSSAISSQMFTSRPWFMLSSHRIVSSAKARSARFFSGRSPAWDLFYKVYGYLGTMSQGRITMTRMWTYILNDPGWENSQRGWWVARSYKIIPFLLLPNGKLAVTFCSYIYMGQCSLVRLGHQDWTNSTGLAGTVVMMVDHVAVFGSVVDHSQLLSYSMHASACFVSVN